MIRFDHVSKTYPGGTQAVDDFSLTIEQGSTTVFLGTSGCGKTTLMRMVNAMVTPTSGTVFVRDQDVTGADPVRLRRSIGYVLQEGGLFPHRSIADNIATVPRLEGVNKAESRERAPELLTLVGLEREMADRYPSQLSGGQRQRVGVARALANRADILLMDEPFGALDPIVRADLQRELKEIRRALGTTILFVTHDVDEAFTLGDQVAVLSAGGCIEQVGTPAELISSPASPFVAEFVGASRAARPVRISRLEVLAAPRISEVCLDEAVVRESACVPGPVRVVDVDVAVECSSGTYVRALARDAGAALGVGAHLTALRRTRVGDFPLEGALTLDELAAAVEDEGGGEQPVLPLIPLGRAALTMFPALPLTEAEAGAFAHGQAPRRSREQLAQWVAQVGDALPITSEGEAPPIAATSPSGEVLGLLRIDAARLRTVLVF